MPRYRPMKPGEKRPCYYCGGRGWVYEWNKETGRNRQVTCSRCNGTKVQ